MKVEKEVEKQDKINGSAGGKKKTNLNEMQQQAQLVTLTLPAKVTLPTVN